ncbi:hypothetical protein OF83DRAFT_1124692 [Amylostereum chailletii]|nr:hypothetical protein OF83DRAFT_1124692 [Amylostereum chailletii]
MDLIQQIRLEHGFDHSVPRAHDDPVLLLRGKLERAVERLSSDLYNKKTHFLLEFIQNADDNSYAPGIVPTLKLRMRDRQISILCNEVGFTAENVRAICDIGASTKKGGHAQGFIGEKGIGFKSVFTIADVVHVDSGPYQFKFDRNLPLGMITPVINPTQTQKSAWTTFRLHLAPSEDESALLSQLSKVQPTLLLFLRQLRQMSIAMVGPNGQQTLTLRRTDENDDKVKLERIDNGEATSELFLIHKELITVPPGHPKREDVETSEIVLAFPVDADEQPIVTMRETHAFLPLRCYGFKFIIQADFLTSASRDDVLVDVDWNVVLRAGITTAFLSAVLRFLSHPTLRLTWFRFLPQNINDSFFTSIEHALVDRLQELLCILNGSGVLRSPQHLIVISPRFSDKFGHPLIPEKHLPYHLEYLSQEYDLKADAQILHRLGVLEMSEDMFLHALAGLSQNDQLTQQTESWHDTVASCLLAFWNKDMRYRISIKQLKIMPLNDGKWEDSSMASSVTFGLEDREIPDGLGIRTVKPGISKTSSRYRLYTLLGVQEASPTWIATKILASTGPKPVRTLIQYARFFFDHRHRSDVPKPLQLRFANEHGLVMNRANELYLDVSFLLDSKECSLHDVLPRSAHFIHPAYLTAYEGYHREEWKQWLCTVVGLNMSPRVLRGLPSPELLDMSTHLSTPIFIAVLRHFWPTIKGKFTAEGYRQLSEAVVTCEDGAKYVLKSTHLKRGPVLQYADLPFLPVNNPTAYHWDFLGDLGVGLRLDVGSMLSILAHMQSSPAMANKDAVKSIYEYLDAEFTAHEYSIRTAFCKPMILIPGEKDGKDKWLRPSEVYWKGPRSIRAKPVLSRIYPSLREFFSVKLFIVDSPSFALVDEALALEKRYGGKAISVAVQEQAAMILADLSEVISLNKETPASFRALSGRAIFPVSSPGGGLMLRKPNKFYVPDTSGRYAKMFGSQISMLALPSSVSLSLLRPLFSMVGFSGEMRHLQTEVTCQVISRGARRPNLAGAKRYASRVESIARSICHEQRGALTDDQVIRLAKLQKIAFFVVDSITTTESLESHAVTSNKDIAFVGAEESPGFIVHVSQKRREEKPVDPDVCEHLARALNTGVRTLFTCVSQDIQTLDQLLQLEGIEQLSDQAREALFPPPAAESPVVPRSPVPEPPAPPPMPTVTAQAPPPPSVKVAPAVSSQLASAQGTTTKDASQQKNGDMHVLRPYLNPLVTPHAPPEPRVAPPPLPPQYPPIATVHASPISVDLPTRSGGAGQRAPTSVHVATTKREDEASRPRLAPSPLIVPNDDRKPIEAVPNIRTPALPLLHGPSTSPEMSRHYSSPPPASPQPFVRAPTHSPSTSTTQLSSGSSSPSQRRGQARGAHDSWSSPQAAVGGIPILAQEASENEVTFAPQGGWVYPVSPEPSRTSVASGSLLKTPNMTEDDSKFRQDSPAKPEVNLSSGSKSIPSTPMDMPSASLPSVPTDEEPRRSGNAPEVDPRTAASPPGIRPSTSRITEAASLVSRLSLTSGTVHGIASRIPASSIRENLQGNEIIPVVVSHSKQDTDEVGLLGEYFIYQLFLKELGPDTFGIQNWTSNLRSLIPGFPAYNGDASADFTFADSTGTLTGMWYGEEMKQAWQGRWPTYHMEGALWEPFHVSQRQISAVRPFSLT